MRTQKKFDYKINCRTYCTMNNKLWHLQGQRRVQSVGQIEGSEINLINLLNTKMRDLLIQKLHCEAAAQQDINTRVQCRGHNRQKGHGS